MNDTIQGKSDWKTIRAPFMFQKGQRPDKITLNVVINGKGILWIDNIVLSREPLQWRGIFRRYKPFYLGVGK
jgi:hypothetical protein